MDKIIPISDLQTQAKKYVDQVKETEQPVVITQRGRAAAVLVSYEAYEGFLATRRDELPGLGAPLAAGGARIEAGQRCLAGCLSQA